MYFSSNLSFKKTQWDLLSLGDLKLSGFLEKDLLSFWIKTRLVQRHLYLGLNLGEEISKLFGADHAFLILWNFEHDGWYHLDLSLLMGFSRVKDNPSLFRHLLVSLGLLGGLEYFFLILSGELGFFLGTN